MSTPALEATLHELDARGRASLPGRAADAWFLGFVALAVVVVGIAIAWTSSLLAEPGGGQAVALLCIGVVIAAVLGGGVAAAAVHDASIRRHLIVVDRSGVHYADIHAFIAWHEIEADGLAARGRHEPWLALTPSGLQRVRDTSLGWLRMPWRSDVPSNAVLMLHQSTLTPAEVLQVIRAGASRFARPAADAG